jgi:FkbM family methyltransferase
MITNTLYRSFARWPHAQEQARRVLIRLPSRRRLVDHFGLHLLVDPTELSGYYLYYERAYDVEVFRFLDSRLPYYKRVLDIGANIGVYTVFFAKRVPHVDAFEPVGEIADWLRENLALNKLNNVRIHEVCISDSVGSADFVPASPINWGVGRISSGQGSVSLECSTLDAFLNGEVNEPTLIKMDIEGAEWMAVKGASRTLKNRHARLDLLLEIHPEQIAEYGGSVTRLAEMLRDAGFTLHAIEQPGLSELEYAPAARFWFAETN